MRVKGSFLAIFIVALIISSMVIIRMREEPSPSVFYQVTIAVRTGGGTTDPISSTYNVTEGSSFVIKAIPIIGWQFDYWLVEGERKIENPITVYPVSNILIEVFFKEGPSPPSPPISYNITIEVVDGKGTTNPKPDKYEVENGKSFTIKAIPDLGWLFDYWFVDGKKESENPLTVHPVADVIVEAYFAKSEPSPMKSELLNTLEYIREKGFTDDENNGFDDDELEAAFYVIAMHYLNSPIENKQEMIDYFNNRQRSDGAWGKCHGERAMQAMWILQAYWFLGVKPKISLTPFLDNYDTWEEALKYRQGHARERQDKYHLVACWNFYYDVSPPWIDQLIEWYEKSLDWVDGPDMHERIHIIYSYFTTGKSIPRWDDIIDLTLSTQREDGSWFFFNHHLLHETVIQVGFLKIMGQLYPDYRTEDIQEAIDKCKPYLLTTYRTATSNGKTYGYFVVDGEDEYMVEHFYFGVMGVVSTELVEGIWKLK